MFKWLRSVLRLGQQKAEKPGPRPEPGGEPETQARPPARDRPDHAPSYQKREPVVVRGRAWYKTAEAERLRPHDQRPAGAPKVEGLVQTLLRGSRYEDRISAAKALSELGTAASAAVPALLESITTANMAVRQAALKALEAIDPEWWKNQAVREVMPLWARTLSRGALDVNNVLTRQLVLIGAPATPGLAQAMNEAGDVVGNVFVLRALAQLGLNAEAAVPEITRLLESEYSQVRIAAAEALERIGPAAAPAIPLLADSLRHWNSDVRRAVAQCLASVYPAAPFEAQASPSLRLAAEAAVPLLLQSLAAENEDLRQAALKALGAIEPDWQRHSAVPQVTPLWAKALCDAIVTVNSLLAKEIVQIGTPAVPGLAKALREEGDVAGNVFILRVLGQMGPHAAQAMPEIVRALESQYAHTRIAAAEALERIGPGAAPAIPAVRASLNHWNLEVRRAMAHCLAQIEPAADPTAQAPKQASRSGAPQVRPQVPMDLAHVVSRLSQPGRLSSMSERVGLCEQALSLVSREADPMLWASLHNELAKSLALSPSGDAAKNIESAIHHFEQALDVYTRQVHPEEWAMVQNNLSAAYRKRTSGDRAENIELAIGCCEKALEVRTRQADPEGWATAHNNLANAYRDRVYGDRAKNIEQTLHHCELALEAFVPLFHPWKWATAHNNLANAYQDRIHGDRADNLEQAIRHYQEALRVFTREAYPVDWAWTHSNLGVAYHARVGGDRADNLEQAIHHSQQALEVYTRQSIPEEWALAHNNLGNAYQDRAHGDRSDNLEKAIWHYKQALEIFTRQSYPERWAAIQDQLADAQKGRPPEVLSLQDSSTTLPPTLSFPQFYEEESRLQPGKRHDLEMVFGKSPDSKYEISLVLVYQWDAEMSEEEAQRLLLRAVAYVSCAIYDAARSAGLVCRASPIPNGRRPAWLIGNEPMPISLTLSDIDISERICQLCIGPMAVRVSAQPVNRPLLARLLEGFEARFSTISV